MAKSTLKKQPSHYPFFFFHLIRFTQLISSIIVSGIMSYFVYHLRRENYAIPWTFLVLLGVSLLTMIVLTFTILLYCCRSLNPIFNMILNGILTLLWSAGFGLLTWAMSNTLTHVCNTANWGSDSGIMICRMYKALFSFALVGLVSTFLAFVTDIIVRRRQTSRGVYTKTKNEKLDDHHTGLYDPVREGPFDATASRTALATAYLGPAEQGKYSYSDTEYHGGYGRT